MEFTLTYKGPLFSAGISKHKHDIRREFHKQLAILWERDPLKGYQEYLKKEHPDTFIRPSRKFEFASFINQHLNLVAELDIILLRPDEPGNIITQAGDIDNRLKTLFDAFQIPDNNQTPESSPLDDETPFYCLLENDYLISKVSVNTQQLLETVDSSEVFLIVQVTTKRTKSTIVNIDLL